MEATPTPDDAQALRQLTLADEHLLICFCGVDETRDCNSHILREAMQKIIRIKIQMGDNHQISLARAHESRLVVEQEFTTDADGLVAVVPGFIALCAQEDLLDLDVLLDDVTHYFGAHQEMEGQSFSSFRLLLIYRQVEQSPRLQTSQRQVVVPFINNPSYHLDVIYWHHNVPLEMAQNVFNQFFRFDNTNPYAKFYFLEVGESLERLHQALVLMLSHPAHRASQDAAEQLLRSCCLPGKSSKIK
ncbi:uncharacterized protein PHALS_07098 [Plasmopara halstedii]|uniref:Uncharacterized protein n=1 Tax=Plasmopara halstedii TaxID=4781 RepID=A0A0P1B5N6_PLAHL|nr:uncharacterized protein PHALS_07098 [Plasmopara halstedii]CEG49329.1 hypothetical protein PHALS_07098 [Plasmopara halstedii]|eukprot:XP_024585698.1 hypothetical protein PHALS_07098 [Plasmopara halstedii]